MAIPSHQELILPVLTMLGDGAEHAHAELVTGIEELFHLTEEEKAQVNKTGPRTIDNRTGWATFDLTKALLARRTSNGMVSITDRGLALLEARPEHVNRTFLLRYPEYKDWKQSHSATSKSPIEKIKLRFESYLPEKSERAKVLNRFVRSIEIAHNISPASWATTAPSADKFVRLNVGPYYSMTIRAGDLSLYLLKSAIGPELMDLINGNDNITVYEFEMTSFSDGLSISFPTKTIDECLPLVAEAHDALVTTIASQRPVCNFGHAHRAAIPEYLRQELDDPTIPDPVYPSKSGGKEPDDVQRDGVKADSRRYWKISPGQGAKYWDDFQSSETISIGWKLQVPPIHEEAFAAGENVREIVAGLPSLSHESSRTRAHIAEQFELFVAQMKSGDFVLAYGAKSVLGVGEITGDYFVKAGDHPHRRAVKWHTTERRPIADLPKGLQGKFQRPTTIFELDGSEFELATKGIFSLDDSTDVSTIAPTFDDLSGRTYLPVQHLQELESLLTAKRQIVLEGPPGSGKTFLADLLARYLTGNPLEGDYDQHMELVQFHQSYSYEDFVQGIRPDTNDAGQVIYEVKAGIFLEMCARAKANPDQNFVLIIDEINRGNLSRIFGELLMLLEYRDRKVRLPYGAGPGAEDGYLSIPKNLYLIGTMNSTDRSLALIDYALRRRFYFHRLLPVEEGRAVVYESWLAAKGFAAEVQAHRLALFIALNQELVRQKLPIDFQIGHSYFMTEDIDEKSGLDRVWTWGIIPLLREYFHNSRDLNEIFAAFDIDMLVQRGKPRVANDSSPDDV